MVGSRFEDGAIGFVFGELWLSLGVEEGKLMGKGLL